MWCILFLNIYDISVQSPNGLPGLPDKPFGFGRPDHILYDINAKTKIVLTFTVTVMSGMKIVRIHYKRFQNIDNNRILYDIL